MSNNFDHFVQLYLEEVPYATENELIREYGYFKKQFVSMYGGGGDIGISSEILRVFLIIVAQFNGDPLVDSIDVMNLELDHINSRDFYTFFAIIIIILLIAGIDKLLSYRRVRNQEEDRGQKGGAVDMLLEAVKKVNLDGNKLFMKGMVILSNIFRKIYLELHNKKAEHIANGLDYIIDHPKNVKEQLIKLFKPVRVISEKEYNVAKEILENNKEIELNVMKMLKN